MKIKKIPKSFFEKSRPEAQNKSLKDIVPFKFSNDKEVKKGKYKNKIIITTNTKGEWYMCKIGDIIGVKNFISDDNKVIGFHYFVVVADESGQICGLNFDLVGTIMSSFKNEKQKRKKLSYKENLEIKEVDFNLGKRTKKNGFIKADQLFYFDKSKQEYTVVGQVDGDVLIKLLERIGYLDKHNKIVVNLKNLSRNQNQEEIST